MTYYTPPQLAKKEKIAVERIRGWIIAGQLRAINISDSDSRPRWRICEEDWLKFLDSRANHVQPSAKAKRKRRGIVQEIF